jgi:hypothetical protein
MRLEWTRRPPLSDAGRMTFEPESALRAELAKLRREAGSPSYKEIEKASASTGRISASTAQDLLAKTMRPRPSTVRSFVRACQKHARDRGISVPPERFDEDSWESLRAATTGPSEAPQPASPEASARPRTQVRLHLAPGAASIPRLELPDDALEGILAQERERLLGSLPPQADEGRPLDLDDAEPLDHAAGLEALRQGTARRAVALRL